VARTLTRMALPRRGALVLGSQAVVLVLVGGWFITGHSDAPDGGLRQVDALTLHERVTGADEVDGRPTLLLAPSTCPRQGRLLLQRYGTPAGLPRAFRIGVVRDPAVVRALALGRSLDRCLPSYALVDGAGFVRYRSYDPGLGSHADEQRVLLESLR